MPTPSHAGSLSIDGTSTALTNEPMTTVSAGLIFQITDTSKQCLDPAVAVVVEVDPDGGGGAPFAVAPAAGYVLDRLFGTVTFLVSQGASAVARIASGNYLPLLTVAEVAEVKLTSSKQMLDASAMGTPARLRTAGLKDMTGSFRLHKLPEYDHDPGAGTKKFGDIIDAGTPMLLQRTRSGGKRFRGWVVLEDVEVQGNVDQLLDTVINFKGTARAGAGTGATDTASHAWEV